MTSDQAQQSERLLSLDTFRGLIMCTLAVNGFALAATAKQLGYTPNTEVDSAAGWMWQTLAFHNSHPFWNSQFYVVGCSYWDLIQPAFMFMVGVAMPYSFASRRNRGHSPRKQLSHALIRAIVLVLIGVFLQTQRNWFDTYNLFTNVLAQIGLGYFFVYLLLGRSAKLQIGVAAVVLTAYTVWLLLFPAPDPLPAAAADSIHSLSVPEMIARHYALGTNGAAQTDLVLLSVVPHDRPIETHPAGYATLNFIPAAITMLLGVLAGTLLKSSLPARDKVTRLLLGGLLCMILAVTASYTVCPVVKKIWTPAWTLYSGAYVLWTLAGLYWIIDVKRWRRWTFPLVVVGTNSLAMYLMGMLIKRWIADRYRNYLGPEIFSGMGGPTIQAVCVFAVLWLICLYLYRSKIFFRI